MINDLDINKRSLGKHDFKYFIGYKDSEKIRPLCIARSQMIFYKTILMKVDIFNYSQKKEKVFFKYIVKRYPLEISKASLIVN